MKKINFLNAGIKKIIIDPGFILEKVLKITNDIEKLRKISKIWISNYCCVSRKSMLTELLDIDSKDALNSTTIVNTIIKKRM